VIGFVFRWVFPAVGLAFVALGLAGAPARGEPPLASLWGGRVETVVTAARIVEDPARFTWPRSEVLVAWPPGSASQAPVGGLYVSARPNQRAPLEAEIARFPPGMPLTVRVAQGGPWADRTDLFALAWTVGAVFLGGLVAAVGIVLNRALR
jgi:hypothetical protein